MTAWDAVLVSGKLPSYQRDHERRIQSERIDRINRTYDVGVKRGLVTGQDLGVIRACFDQLQNEVMNTEVLGTASFKPLLPS